MGILATEEVIECSVTDLVGQFVGHTGPKTEKLLEKALGKVLFIDEAYRLADGAFAKEATDQLVDSLTKERFYKRLVVILAGYDGDINRLLSANLGLSSRFSATMAFTDLAPSECWSLLEQILGKNKQIDSTIMVSPDAVFKNQVTGLFQKLSVLPGWGNARDVQAIAAAVIGTTFTLPLDEGARMATLKECTIIDAVRSMLAERERRMLSTTTQDPCQAFSPATATATPRSHNASTVAQRQPKSAPAAGTQPILDRASTSDDQTGCRDAGVSDEDWNQLLSDVARMRAQEEHDNRAITEEENARRQLADPVSTADGAERRAYEEKLRILAKERLAAEERKRREEAVQTRLQETGVCPMAYRWIKQESGYRCAGGSHFVANSQIA